MKLWAETSRSQYICDCKNERLAIPVHKTHQKLTAQEDKNETYQKFMT